MYDFKHLLSQLEEELQEQPSELSDLEEIEKIAEYLEKCAEPDRPIDFLAKLAAWWDFKNMLRSAAGKAKNVKSSLNPLQEQLVAAGAAAGVTGVGSKVYMDKKLKKKEKELEDVAAALYLAGRASAGGNN